PAEDAPSQEDEKPSGRQSESGAEQPATAKKDESATEPRQQDRRRVMPAAARILAQHDIDPQSISGTGPGGRIVKEDALKAVSTKKTTDRSEDKQQPKVESSDEQGGRGERRERMSPIRRTIAERLLDAKQNMALLTTFNEADMSEVKLFRKTFGEGFAEKHGVRLGFMSFFVKASTTALLDFPLVNAKIDGDDIVYHDSCDIGVAIGGGKGLVVPVLRHAEQMSFAEIEKKIAEFADKAKNNALSLKELEGGTFTISNGGIYGSMLSTPIVNPPQSAILGLHAIKDRPVAINGEVKIRPVMYLALSYDHRIIDGREAVSFLKSIKERIEQPQKLLIDI
ncbi:MAG: 2-oxoglutarate dehydrogenase complex dihydrolipoyllysine-residue succinyltransferase, partial [Desulforhopalus sp.]